MRIRTGCKEKRAAHAKFVGFHLLIELISFDVLIAVAVTVAFVVATVDVRKRLGIRTRFYLKRLPSFL